MATSEKYKCLKHVLRVEHKLFPIIKHKIFPIGILSYFYCPYNKKT